MEQLLEVKLWDDEVACLLTRMLDLTDGSLNRNETFACKKLWDALYPGREYNYRLVRALEYHGYRGAREGRQG